ncbi:MAG: hypothetical protein AAF720_06090 [Pseudomonadota bacterium]
MNIAHIQTAIAGIIIVGGIAWSILNFERPVDDKNCRLDGVVRSHTLFIIDQSDPFTSADRGWVRELIKRESIDLMETGKLTVLSLDAGNQAKAREIFSRCSPGAPNEWTGFSRNRRKTVREWQQRFLLDLNETIDAAMENDRAPSSPLFEAFEGVMRRPDFSKFVDKRRLVIISDMIQFSPRFSMLSGNADWDRFVSETRYSRSNVFADTDVVIHLAERSRGPNNLELKKFWETYFVERGGASLEFVIDF